MIRDFIIGKEVIPSLKVFKQAMLRGRLTLVMAATGLTYIAIDLYYSLSRNIPLYLALLVVSSVAFWLNRKKYFRASTILLLLLGNGIIYLFASSESVTSAVYVFFIPASLGALALFGYSDWFWGLALIALSYILFLAAYLVDFSFLLPVTYTDDYERVNFIFNFTIALTVSVLIVYFLININHHAEKTLKDNEERLIKITEQLKQSRERFELAVKGSQAGIYEWNLKSNSIYLSPHWKEMLGYSPDDNLEMTVDKFIEMVHPDDRERTRLSVQNHLATGLPYKNELRMLTNNGTHKWFYDSGLCKRNENGEPETVIGSIIDISERKKAEQQILEQNELLAKANDELDRFVYSVSHDLRAPLSSILGLVGLAEKAVNDEELKTYLGLMRGRINAQERFIRDIIDYSRNARLEVTPETINLKEAIQEVIDSLRFADEVSVVKLKTEIPEDFTIRTDKIRFTVVLNNLVSNALKYHDKYKEMSYVTIRATQNGNRKRITIEDNGIGIHTEHIEKVFNMFHRASENSKGSGLGLYIVRETLAKLSGEIYVESEFGKGSSFHIDFPSG